jgi:endoglucanase
MTLVRIWQGVAVFAICGQMASAGPEPYASGLIFPDGQRAMDVALADFYADWKSVYLIEGCGDNRAYVGINADAKRLGGATTEDSLTVSEAQGYGMLILVQMADFDPDAQRLFDAMVRFWQDHPAASDPALMAWNQTPDCGTAGQDLGGDHTATDGDLDVAYALLLAETRWGDHDAFHYGNLARATLTAILGQEVSDTNHILLGDWVAGTDFARSTRTSDLMPSHFAAFAAATGDPRWLAIRDRSYAILSAVQNPQTGLVPDFVIGLPDHAVPAKPEFLEGAGDGQLSWNAVRVPWRVALDALLNGEPRARAFLTPFNEFAQGVSEGDPYALSEGYALDGSVPPEVGAAGMTFISMFAVAAMAGQDETWLRDLWVAMVETSVADEDYFGNTLKLLAMIGLSGHWAKP